MLQETLNLLCIHWKNDLSPHFDLNPRRVYILWQFLTGTRCGFSLDCIQLHLWLRCVSTVQQDRTRSGKLSLTSSTGASVVMWWAAIRRGARRWECSIAAETLWLKTFVTYIQFVSMILLTNQEDSQKRRSGWSLDMQTLFSEHCRVSPLMNQYSGTHFSETRISLWTACSWLKWLRFDKSVTDRGEKLAYRPFYFLHNSKTLWSVHVFNSRPIVETLSMLVANFLMAHVLHFDCHPGPGHIPRQRASKWAGYSADMGNLQVSRCCCIFKFRRKSESNPRCFITNTSDTKVRTFRLTIGCELSKLELQASSMSVDWCLSLLSVIVCWRRLTLECLAWW